MKFVRREGVQVVLVNMDYRLTKHDFLVHADEIKPVPYPISRYRLGRLAVESCRLEVRRGYLNFGRNVASNGMETA